MELRFEGSEELGYDPLGTPPKGEICLRGPLIFQGYFQDKKKTEEAFGAPLCPMAISCCTCCTTMGYNLWPPCNYLHGLL